MAAAAPAPAPTTPDCRNVVVSGVARSGTSLMCLALRAKGYTLLEDAELSRVEAFGNRGECELTVHGINGGRAERYRPYKERHFLKIIYRGLIATPIAEIDDIKHIIVMHRPWREHQRSVTHTQRMVLREMHAKAGVAQPFDEFAADVMQPVGMQYGTGYVRLLTDAINRNYLRKLSFVDMNKVLADPDAVSASLHKACGVHLDPAVLKKRPDYPDTTVYTEFEPGFFTFLDSLGYAMSGQIPLDAVLPQFAVWGPKMAARARAIQDRVRAKYRIDLAA